MRYYQARPVYKYYPCSFVYKYYPADNFNLAYTCRSFLEWRIRGRAFGHGPPPFFFSQSALHYFATVYQSSFMYPSEASKCL